MCLCSWGCNWAHIDRVLGLYYLSHFPAPIFSLPVPWYQLGLGGRFYWGRPFTSLSSQFFVPYAVQHSKQRRHATSEGILTEGSRKKFYSFTNHKGLQIG